MLRAEHFHPDQAGALGQLHILVALGIMAAYLTIPFIGSIRGLPVWSVTRAAGGLFFLTCALTHLSIAAGFHDSPWMILSDVVQLGAVTTFITSFARLLARSEAHRAAQSDPDDAAAPVGPGRDAQPPAETLDDGGPQ